MRVIHAVYEKGVFRPTEPVDLPESSEVEVELRVLTSSEGGRLDSIDSPADSVFRRRRSELPVARPATGRTLPALSNVEIQRILDEEEAAGGRPD